MSLLHEDLGRVKVKEAIERGLESQRIHRMLREAEGRRPPRRPGMGQSRLVLVVLLVLTTLASVGIAQANSDAIEDLRRATRQYHRLETALADGFEPFLDCLSDPEAGGMGFHYVNFGIVDTTVETLRPEAMLYEHRPDGEMRLIAVEYVVDAAAWDEVHSRPPRLFGERFGLNEALGVYALHAWVWRDNPSGIFADYNPRVSCPG